MALSQAEQYGYVSQNKYVPMYGQMGGAIGYGLDRLAVKKFGASSTSLTGAGVGAGIGLQYGGPWGALFGAAAGAAAQQGVETVKHPGETKLFATTATGNGLPIVGYTPFPAEWLPFNPSINEILDFF